MLLCGRFGRLNSNAVKSIRSKRCLISIDYNLDKLDGSPAVINQIAERVNQPELANWIAQRDGQPVSAVAEGPKEAPWPPSDDHKMPAWHDLGCLREYFTKSARKSLLFKGVRMAILRSRSVYFGWR
jgi:hypothetical protein